MVVSVRNCMMKIRSLCICSVKWSWRGAGGCSHKVEGLIRIFWLCQAECHRSRAKLSHTIFSLLPTTHCPPVCSTWHPFNSQIISLGHINRPLESTSHNTNSIIRKQYALQLPFAVIHFTNVPIYILGMSWLQTFVCVTTSTLEHIIWGTPNPCFWATICGSRIIFLLFPLKWELCFASTVLLIYNMNYLEQDRDMQRPLLLRIFRDNNKIGAAPDDWGCDSCRESLCLEK